MNKLIIAALIILGSSLNTLKADSLTISGIWDLHSENDQVFLCVKGSGEITNHDDPSIGQEMWNGGTTYFLPSDYLTSSFYLKYVFEDGSDTLMSSVATWNEMSSAGAAVNTGMWDASTTFGQADSWSIWDPQIDEDSPSSIPEPTSGLLVLVGIGAMLIKRKL